MPKPTSGKAGSKGRRPKAARRKGTRRRGAAGSKPAVARESGPRGWILPTLESAYTRLVPRGTPAPGPVPAARGPRPGARGFRSRLQPGRGEAVLAAAPQEMWLDTLAEYQRRKASAAAARGLRVRAAGAPRPGPVVVGERNWAPLGPSVVLDGQAQGLPPVAGRISGLAVAPGGQLVFAASANGGVFRSDDGGVSWRALMDAFDLDPTHFASTSLACGAIALAAGDPDRIYVGTGEGDTHMMFQQRVVNALPAYRGIGPIRSDDGGSSWRVEPTAEDSPPLAGKAFFALAVDPDDDEHVVGATTEGLYERRLEGGDPVWTRRREGVHGSVVVARGGGAVRFWAAEWGVGVFHSRDGESWTAARSGFPASNVGRIALAVQPSVPGRVFALVATTRGALRGVYRLDGPGGTWKTLAGPPDVLPAEGGAGQGDYDLAIAVDPVDPDLLYLGGSYFADGELWPASIWRCAVKGTDANPRLESEPIGQQAHADVHVLVHTPGDPGALWAGCDGGVFLNRDPRDTGTFQARNDGLACLCTNFFAQHPTDPGILFCGLQDNGTARASGGPIWKHVAWGDGGYCLINWADPDQVLVFANGTVYRATDGGKTHDSWSAHSVGWETMTEPIVGPPYAPDSPNDARLVGVGVGDTVHFSPDFGRTWPSTKDIPMTGSIFALTFATPRRFFVGTTAGEVFRLDRSGSGWRTTRLDDAVAGPLGLRGLIGDVAIDWADANLESVFVAFGGTGDYRHVWYFDGTRWEARSGPPGVDDNLLDVEHNALVVDREAPDHLYAGADIGVWHSPDRGATWQPMPNGLPDAPVFDLQIHPSRRLLRASTHGRGLFEWTLE